MTGKSHERVTDRRRAIRRALELAGKNDVVILAGKGHETYQIRGDKSYPFDEREIVQEIRSGVRG
jgi:UDP-N-acetylmuramyl tripeptide synthase